MPVTTGLRGEIAKLLDKAREASVDLANQTGNSVLLYLIEMALLEVLAQEADAMEEAGLLVSENRPLRLNA